MKDTHSICFLILPQYCMPKSLVVLWCNMCTSKYVNTYVHMYGHFGFKYFVVYFTVFRDKPPTPPSMSQMALLTADKEPYVNSIKRLFTNKGYLLLLTSYGMNVGVFYAISTLLSSFILKYHPVSCFTRKTLLRTLVFTLTNICQLPIFCVIHGRAKNC